MSATFTYRANQELPSWAADWKDRDGNLIDFASGYTWEVKLVNKATGTTGLTKTTGITGAATSPNVIVAWAAGELDLTPGLYRMHLKATSGGQDRMYAPGNEPTIQIVASS